MKTKLLLGLSIIVLSGCETLQTPQQRREATARQQAAARHAEERAYRMQGGLESVEMENARLVQEVQQLRSEVRSCNSQISQLNSKMASLESKQAREMNELIKRVEKLLKKSVASRPSRSSSGRGTGREHVVEPGHTLSAIAQAYGTTVKAIKQANNLKSDSIRVGQKLFIPE
ncbi:MAG: LysM peptidoglycan-binding domain-containing protein [Verrucomicrobiota bacterium]